MHLDVLLADKLEEFAHLLYRRFFALAIIPAARAVLVMLGLLRVEDVPDDCLQLWRETFLRADELELVGAILLRYLRYFIRNTIVLVLVLGGLHLALEGHSSSSLISVVLLDLQERFLGHSELVFQNAVNHLQSALFVEILLTEMVTVAFLDGKVEKGRLFCWLIHIICLLYACQTFLQVLLLLTESSLPIAHFAMFGAFARLHTLFPS